MSKLTPNQSTAYRSMIEETLRKQGEIEFTTTGTSMRYMMGDGDHVVVRGCEIGGFRFGDVVLLKVREQENRLYVVHRIINILRDGDKIQIETKGDSSPKDGFLFDAETCLGKVISFRRHGHVYSLEHPIWKLFDPMIALMSRWVSHFSEQAARRGKKKQVLIQRLLHSIIKRLAKVGMYLSQEN